MSTKIQVSITKIIQFKFAYTVEELAEWFQVNPEAILADLEAYTNMRSRSDVLDIVLRSNPYSKCYKVNVLSTENLEIS